MISTVPTIYETLSGLPRWEVRFLSFVLVGDDCWSWYGHHTHDGYARFSFSPGESADGTRDAYAHVLLYEKFVGKVPEGMDLDHLCRNRGCINFAHLEPVSHETNLRRGHGYCKVGHNLQETRRRWPCGRSRCGVCQEMQEQTKRNARKALGLKRGRKRKTLESIPPSERTK